MKPQLLAALMAAGVITCSASEQPRVAQGCTAVTVGNMTVIVEDPPSAILGRVGQWKLGNLNGELGSGWGIMERSDVRETVQVFARGRRLVVSASLTLRERDEQVLSANCGPHLVSMSNMRIGNEELLEDTGVAVLRAITETGGK